MTKIQNLHAIVAAIAVFATFAIPAHAAASRAVSTAEKNVSDQHMKDGIAAEQAAYTALGNGNNQAATQDLQTAWNDMHQALPIYWGYRASSMDWVRKAIGHISHNRLALASVTITTAGQEAQTALQVSDTFTQNADIER
jgi:hypothetical protein